jgi:predicted RNA-binding Zn-ribbon protein involved in translation (DUF1610 family)
MRFALTLFLLSLLLLPTVLSDVVEITIEYETTTVGTTTTPTETTTPIIGGGGGGIGVTTTTTIPPSENVMMGYEMPAFFEVYQNETASFTVTVKNMGTLNLTDVVLELSGIPTDSFSITPSRIDMMEPGVAYSFSIIIDSTALSPGNYTLTLSITSNEVSETTSLVLNVKEYPREIGEIIEKEKEIEEKVKPAVNVFKYLFVGIIVVACVVLAIVFIFYKVNRCPICGGNLTKEYETENFVSFTCEKCGHRLLKKLKKIKEELKHDETQI